jgi:peptidoglycan/LPS O-acetylase OafA/YrhL
MEKKYFEGLDVIRALAALLVIVHHIEHSVYLEFGHVGDLGIVHNAVVNFLGKRGVHIFFMLSGFLITYLLIQEKLKHKHIAIGKFYLRRILRIWPLYFLTVFIGFGILPTLFKSWEFLGSVNYYNGLIEKLETGGGSPIYYFLFFVPNLANQFFAPVMGASHLWSIGVEEQFYLFWPLIFLIKNFRLQLLVIGAIALMPHMLSVLDKVPGCSEWANLARHFPFYWMAMGGLGAFVFHYFQNPLERMFNRFSSLSWLLVFLFLGLSLLFKINNYLFGLMGLILILRFSIGYQWLPAKFPILGFLGKISFGLYIYHPVVMFVVISAFQFYLPQWHEVSALKICVYLAITLLTILIAWASFRFFERPFIQLKDNKFKSA